METIKITVLILVVMDDALARCSTKDESVSKHLS